MTYSLNEKKRIRKNFATKKNILEVPHLIKLTKDSFKVFLQKEKQHDQKENQGLQKLFREIFPIIGVAQTAELDFVSYRLGEPEFTVLECKQRGETYSLPMYVTLRLHLFDKEASKNDRKKIKNIQEQEVYFGVIPMMTETGSFVINGTERVIVTQLHRSPGVIFDSDRGKTHSSGKILFNARIIPYRGSWLDFEYDHHDNIFVRIDRKRKFPVTVLLRALGYDSEQILNEFYQIVNIKIKKDKAVVPLNPKSLLGSVASFDIISKDGEVLVSQGKRVNERMIDLLEDKKISANELPVEFLQGRVLAKNLTIDGELVGRINDYLDASMLTKIEEYGKEVTVKVLTLNENQGSYISNTLRLDVSASQADAQVEIYRIIRPGERATPELAKTLFNGLFFDYERYSLSQVGRMKLNRRLNNLDESGELILEKEDIVKVIKELISIRNGASNVDEVDTLVNRRLRNIGEMAENAFRLGMVRVNRAVRERLNIAEQEEFTPQDLINSKPITSALNEFFGKGQLSQFMDQVNPLAEVTHKRRISALGPGGLTRERAGFEVRDVHATHYGRICPIETPEGPNIGLINSLSIYAKSNNYGFLETPYRKVVDGVVTDEIVYISSINEEGCVIAQAGAKLDANNKLTDSIIAARKNNEFIFVNAEEVQFIDVSAQQIVSAAASLIPFLEHDDANRALMGSNMQRQAVPSIRAEKPFVGTGFEKNVSIDSGAVITAKRGGQVVFSDSSRIVVKVNENELFDDDSGVDIYNLIKFQRSNQNTCINNIPIVKVDDRVVKNEILADGPSTDLGELSLGQNMRVAFMPWNGYNFEDSILISEKVVNEDRYTSIHIEEHTCIARETKQGDEEITADIPNVSEKALSKLDETGVIYVGAKINPGDILAGKVTPKGEYQPGPEEKLLKAIFGEKAQEVKDTSYRVGSSSAGTVIDVQIYGRKEMKQDSRTQQIIENTLDKYRQDLNDQMLSIEDNACSNIKKLVLNKEESKGKKLTQEIINALSNKDILNITLKDKATQNKIINIKKYLGKKQDDFSKLFDEKKERLNGADNMPPGVLKMVKVYVAVKRKLQPGDKMAGRHGNKGVISRICPVEDMPYDKDGVPIDICLNPLGVPSRMNVGQIFEAHLGLAAKGLGKKIEKMLENQTKIKEIRDFLEKIYNKTDGQKEDLKSFSDQEIIAMAQNLKSGIPFATPVFDGVSEMQIKSLLELADLPISGQIDLYDGQTGEKFNRPVTVGYMYALKLNHLVDDKMHARSTGSYSLVTQQPLGGKAQFGGQRLGEMEVWALEAYGASYTLQEMLTVKSDDLSGRTLMYKNIVAGNQYMESSIPESFGVLRKEIRALGIDLELEE